MKIPPAQTTTDSNRDSDTKYPIPVHVNSAASDCQAGHRAHKTGKNGEITYIQTARPEFSAYPNEES